MKADGTQVPKLLEQFLNPISASIPAISDVPLAFPKPWNACLNALPPPNIWTKCAVILSVLFNECPMTSFTQSFPHASDTFSPYGSEEDTQAPRSGERYGGCPSLWVLSLNAPFCLWSIEEDVTVPPDILALASAKLSYITSWGWIPVSIVTFKQK